MNPITKSTTPNGLDRDADIGFVFSDHALDLSARAHDASIVDGPPSAPSPDDGFVFSRQDRRQQANRHDLCGAGPGPPNSPTRNLGIRMNTLSAPKGNTNL